MHNVDDSLTNVNMALSTKNGTHRCISKEVAIYSLAVANPANSLRTSGSVGRCYRQRRQCLCRRCETTLCGTGTPPLSALGACLRVFAGWQLRQSIICFTRRIDMPLRGVLQSSRGTICPAHSSCQPRAMSGLGCLGIDRHVDSRLDWQRRRV